MYAKHRNNKNRMLFLIFDCLILLALLLVTLDKNIFSLNSTTAQLLTSTNTTTSSSPSTKDTKSCIDSSGFSIDYPSNWTRFPGTCTFFSPTLDTIFPVPQAYVRISYTNNLSIPMPSIYELARNVIFFTNHGAFKLSNPPNYFTLKIGNAVELDYDWNSSLKMLGPPQIALPFVNQSSMLPTKPLVTPYGNAPFTAAITPSAPTSANNSATTLANNFNAPTSSKMKTAAIYFISNNNVYVIEYTAPEDKFIQYFPQVREMIGTFEFVSRTFSR